MNDDIQSLQVNQSDDAPFETMLSRFGSRFTINPQVKEKAFRISPIGTYHWGDSKLAVSVEAGNDIRQIPFGDQPFSEIHQTLKMTSIDYTASDPDFPLECKVSFIAPFYPQDTDFCCTPAIYLRVRLRNKSKQLITGRLSLSMDGESRQVKGRGYSARVHSQAYDGPAGAFRAEVALGYINEDSVVIGPGEVKELWGILAGFTSEPVLDINGTPYFFRYARLFSDIEEVLEYAARNRDEELRTNAIFESTVLDSSLAPYIKELIAFGFQSFAANSWLAASKSNDEWFSVWEGNCGYHSTIDVEYNQAPFYLQYWPDLLKMLFDEWATYKTESGFMEHDMGLWKSVRQAEYGHPMKVEENTNFLLMLASYWKATGDESTVRKHFALAKELVEFLISCDTNGNSFPDEGVENTLDSGSFVVELSKDQSYLAVKCITSYLMFAEIADTLGEGEFAAKLRTQADKTLKTLDNEAWFGDHYAVCLDQTVRGWNTYTMMVDNGLFFPLRSGFELPFRRDRIIVNLHRSLSETKRPDSQRMTAVDNNGWFSQQMFRDMIASHLGIDLNDLWADYLAYQKRVNREDSNCFKDAWPPGVATLNYYPRGLAASGILQSAGGISVNALTKHIVASPPKTPVRLPLTMLADWGSGRIPWLAISQDGKASINGMDLPADWTLEVKLPPPQGELLSRPPQASIGPEFFVFWGKGEVSGRHGYWSAEEMFEGKPFEICTWFRAGKEPARDLNVAVTTALGIELEPLDEETFTTLNPGEVVRYTYRVSISKDYTWTEEPAIRVNWFFRTEDTNVTLPDKTLIFTKDPRKKFQQTDIQRQEAGYR